MTSPGPPLPGWSPSVATHTTDGISPSSQVRGMRKRVCAASRGRVLVRSHDPQPTEPVTVHLEFEGAIVDLTDRPALVEQIVDSAVVGDFAELQADHARLIAEVVGRDHAPALPVTSMGEHA